MNRHKAFLLCVLSVMVLLWACSRGALSSSRFSSRADFARAHARADTSTSKLLFPQYIQQELSAREQYEFDAMPVRRAVTDPYGHSYHATGKGFLICVPQAAQDRNQQEVVLYVRALRVAARALDAPLRALFASDGFGRVADSTESCNVYNGKDGLPHERLTNIALCSGSGEIVLGSKHGVILFSSGIFYHFAGLDMLPDNDVINVFCWPSGTVWVKTRTGYSKIVRISLTLEEKEKDFNKQLARFRFGGLINSLRNGIRAPGDNDGLWTALVVAADSFRYATVKAKDREAAQAARRRADESVSALMMLERVTGASGYFARTAFRADDVIAYDWKTSRGDWNYSESMPGWVWKGDTSVDELVGHLFAYTVYYDYVADELGRLHIRSVVNRIADRLLAHHLDLVDHRDNITTWGRGNPDYTRIRAREFLGRGPLSLGTLASVAIMEHITGRSDIRALYHKLITEYGFALSMQNAKILIPGAVNHSDDQLMFLSYYNLIRLETDPYITNLYVLSLNRYWQIERAERNPLWNFMYCALSGNMCDIEAGLLTLREFPLNLRVWGTNNSDRSDITLQFFRDRHNNLQSNEALPYSDRALGRWNDNPYALDSAGDGSVELEPVMWLLPYWLGKYHNLF